jgi:hypothetical protein
MPTNFLLQYIHVVELMRMLITYYPCKQTLFIDFASRSLAFSAMSSCLRSPSFVCYCTQNVSWTYGLFR